MKARGMTHQEIASELQVSRTAITSDIAYMLEQAKDAINEYATDHLPAQYQVCHVAHDSIKQSYLYV
jgi:orotate phosphoribosyltransferase-like protein